MFYGWHTNLKTVVIPDSVTKIGDSTFSGWSNLKTVTIGKGVQSIGELAFYNCAGLTKLTIGKGVQSIGSSAFYNCTALQGVYITDLAAWLKISFADSYYSNPLYYAKKLYMNGKLMTDVVIPSGVTSIPDRAFYGMESIKSVTIPDSVKSVGESVFSNCTGLTQVTIGKGVQSIGSSAFYNCTGLTQVTIGKGVQSIGSSAFYNCTALQGVYISDLAAWLKISFADSYSNPMYYAKKLYLNGKLMTDVVIPSGVTSIPDMAFYRIESIKSVSIPDSVKSIGDDAFYNCAGLTQVTIGKGVQSIGKYAFYSCTNIKSVTIPDSVKSIGDYAFRYCYQIKHAAIPAGVTTIGEGALPYTCDIYGKTGSEAQRYAQENNCTFIPIGQEIAGGTGSWSWILDKSFTLTIKGKGKTDDFLEKRDDGYWYVLDAPWGNGIKKAVIGNGITEIGAYAFSDSAELESVSIAKSVKRIGDDAFEGCSSLTKVELPDGLKAIESFAFENCTNLKSIYIPASVTDIGWYALGFAYDYNAGKYQKIDGFKIFGYPSTEAQRYAKSNGLTFVDLSTQSVPVIGDVDSDGAITIIDATCIQRKLASLPTISYNENLADTDQDGLVTIIDATYIQRWLADLPSSENIGKPVI